MNFIKAIQHATIGYGIRRKIWASGPMLTTNNFGDLEWTHAPYECRILGPSESYDLQEKDIKATDWEAI